MTKGAISAEIILAGELPTKSGITSIREAMLLQK